ncbi:DUF1028 domain-containing protein [Flavobacteriaceae bacterium 14752]|uniref:DUF1028 domain-containing protein n=1 Tax=Mesohalobacter salilacus TaxID=2491711 RepID=UPI000F62F9C2|nr:DUF1028 domain-containing protein [Flavobacteriaceae bacterium 14752]
MKLLFCLSLCLIINSLYAQKQAYKDQFAHTFSVVAKDEKTGEMGVAVQSHWFSVGTVVAWAKSGVGAVATQSFVNPSYGANGLKLMEEGLTAEEALGKLVRMDEGEAFRQVAFVDQNGNTAAHTGEKCVESAAHIAHDNFSVQANMMLNDKVVPAMQYAFMKYDDLPLAERLVEVLKAAQKAGGDIRGKQSAALLVVGPEKVEHPWEDKLVDLRVDDHKTPIKELERLLKVKRGYDWMNKGDLAIEDNDIEAALDAYSKAEELLKGNIEVTYWKAISLWNADEKEKAIPILKGIFKKDENWKTLTYRLIDSEIISASEEELDKYF